MCVLLLFNSLSHSLIQSSFCFIHLNINLFCIFKLTQLESCLLKEILTEVNRALKNVSGGVTLRWSLWTGGVSFFWVKKKNTWRRDFTWATYYVSTVNKEKTWHGKWGWVVNLIGPEYLTDVNSLELKTNPFIFLYWSCFYAHVRVINCVFHV